MQVEVSRSTCLFLRGPSRLNFKRIILIMLNKKLLSDIRIITPGLNCRKKFPDKGFKLELRWMNVCCRLDMALTQTYGIINRPGVAGAVLQTAS